MTTLGSPLSLELALFEVVDSLDVGFRVLCSISSVIVAFDASGVSSMTPMFVRLMMTLCTMVSSTTLVDALAWMEEAFTFLAATASSSAPSSFIELHGVEYMSYHLVFSHLLQIICAFILNSGMFEKMLNEQVTVSILGEADASIIKVVLPNKM